MADHTSDPARAMFEQLSSVPLARQSLHTFLQTVVDLTAQALPGDVEASVSVLIAGSPTTFVHTGQLALDLDQTQYALGHGPCLQAVGTGNSVEVTDARTEFRWPDYTRRAAQLDTLSSMSLPLGSADQMAASLNVYARPADAFDTGARRTATEFARFAGIAVANIHAFHSALALADNLERALTSRAVIDQAKGVLIERHHLTADQAFGLLARTSMSTNRKLRDVADHLVLTGELPTHQTSA